MRSTLSVCCLTAGPTTQVAAMLSTLRDVADEIVVAVDDRLATDELAPLLAVADVVRLVTVGDSGSERLMNWLLGQCTCDWILRLDSDEVPSVALRDALPDLVACSDVVQYVLARRWCYPDLDHWLDERPWAPDWQARLGRNLPSLRLEPQTWHAGLVRMDPHRFVFLPIYHLDCAVNSLAEREQKAAAYERLRPGHATEDGFNVNWYYLPEHHARRPPAPLPAEDANVIASVLAPTSDGAATSFPRRVGAMHPVSVPAEEIDRVWAFRTVADSAYRGTLTLLEALPSLRAGATTHVTVLVRNDGTEIWPWGDSRPGFRLGHRWRSAGGTSVTQEGRTLFTADVAPSQQAVQDLEIRVPDQPGNYVLDLDVVHEHARWLGCGPQIAVTVVR